MDSNDLFLQKENPSRLFFSDQKDFEGFELLLDEYGICKKRNNVGEEKIQKMKEDVKNNLSHLTKEEIYEKGIQDGIRLILEIMQGKE
ncbi:MAG: hypothetical protein IKU24_05965 [Clostridia bacterium]|nr:hypothetical protein [Clostridia bacterium]